MKNDSYSVLHLHSHIGSVLDSMVRVEDTKKKPNELMKKCEEYGIESVALTDHGSMAGVLTHYQTCKKHGVKPIIGCEVYVTNDMFKKDKTSRYYHLILLAKNEKGYFNLKRLSSMGYTDGFYRKPRIDFDMLYNYSEGLICCTACLAGELPRMIMAQERGEQSEYDEYESRIHSFIKMYQQTFGDDLYLEMQSSDNPEQIVVNRKLVKLSKELNIPLVITTDVHFLNKEDFDAHNIYININQDRDTENYKYCYLQSREEIIEIMSQHFDKDIINMALDNTNKVAEKCNVEITLNEPKLPDLDVGDSYDSEYDWLVNEIKQGLKDRGILDMPNKKEYIERVKYELNVIKTKGFEGYFLILMEIIREAKKRGIPIGEGRGSAAGCLIAYLIGITNVDSVKYDLDFGRFLTIERTSLPDVDSDLSTARRGEFIQMVTDMFGEENVSQIATFGTLASKACIDAVGKVMNIPKEDRAIIKNKVDESIGVTSIKKNEPKIYQKYKDFIDTCIKIEGLNRSFGCHAGALCISGNNKPTISYSPVMKNKDDNIMTQFEMHDAETCGLVKYDMLGLTSLDYIADTLKLIGSDYYSFDFDYNDQEVFDMISRGENTAVFQADSNFASRVLTSVKPHSINELADCVSLGRPDAIQFLDPYVKAKFGIEEVQEIHPDLTNILSRTYGCLIYQEQMMNIFKVFGGFSDGEADKVRKIIGKKQVENLPEQIEKFKKGAKERGYEQKVIDKLVYFINNNISYSFNMAHAVAYAITSYKTAYLKCHYPVEFMTAVINNQKTDDGSTDFDKVKAYIKASNDMNINVVGININSSDRKFKPNGSEILFGLDLVKGLSQKGIDIVIANRPYESYCDFIDRVGLQLSKSDVITLIKSGAFNEITDAPKKKLLKYFYLKRFENKKEELKPIANVNKNHIKWLYDNGLINEEQKSDKEYCIKVLNKYRLSEGWKIFSDSYCQGTELDWEMETLNCYLSADPFDGVVIPDWNKVDVDDTGYVGGVIVNVKETTIKNGKSKGQKMAFINVSTKDMVADIVVFNKQYLNYKDILKTGKCVVCKVEKQGKDKGVLKSLLTLNDYLDRTTKLQGR